MWVNVLIIFGSQILFALGSLLARHATRDNPITSVQSIMAIWFIVYLGIRFVATMLELFVLSRVDLGQTVALAGVCGLITANVMGVLFLGEVLSWQAYLGIAFAIAAILLLSYK